MPVCSPLPSSVQARTELVICKGAEVLKNQRGVNRDTKRFSSERSAQNSELGTPPKLSLPAFTFWIHPSIHPKATPLRQTKKPNIILPTHDAVWNVVQILMSFKSSVSIERYGRPPLRANLDRCFPGGAGRGRGRSKTDAHCSHFLSEAMWEYQIVSQGNDSF